MDYLSVIKQPVQAELADFIELFNRSLSHEDGMLGSALEHIRRAPESACVLYSYCSWRSRSDM